jgi:hypothetical protein
MENFYINSITEKWKIILTNEKSFEILLFPLTTNNMITGII